jgi:hypothetical protein
LIRHSLDGVLVRPVTVNRFESSLIVSDDLEKEITIRLAQDEEVSRLLAG